MTATGSGAGTGSCNVSLGEDSFVVKIQLVVNGYYTAPIEDAATAIRVWCGSGTYYQLGSETSQRNVVGGNIQVRP